MDFLKRHYEKFILLGLFILFSLLMLGLLGINEKTRSVQEEDLELPPRRPDHVVMNKDDEQFHVTQLWKNRAMVWHPSVSRSGNKDGKYFSDLVQPYELSFCPHCAQLNKKNQKKIEVLIPSSSFGSHCPVCQQALPAPIRKVQALRGFKTKNDLDGDGIPNDVEKKFNMDPNNPDDALADMDGDGFSNFYEINQNTDPTNVASHPPFWHRLYLADIKQVELPPHLMALNDNNSENKKDWEIQYNFEKKGKTITRFASLGDVIDIEKREYRVEDMERIHQEAKNAAGATAADSEKAKRIIDKSKVYLVEIVENDENGKLLHAPDKLVMVVGQPVYSSDKRPLLSDSGMPGKKAVQLKIGGKIRVAANSAKTKRLYNDYILEAVDSEKMTVSLRDAKAKPKEDGTFDLYIVKKDGPMPPYSRMMLTEETTNRNPDEMMMRNPDFPVPVPQRGAGRRMIQ